MDRTRLLQLSNVLAAYSLGDFKVKAPLSDQLDELDSIISGVNMLGEELSATTVSRDLLSSIYNTVQEVIVVLDLDGTVVDTNRSVKHLGDPKHAENKRLTDLLIGEEETRLVQSYFDSETHEATRFDYLEKESDDPNIFSCYLSPIRDKKDQLIHHLFVMRDVTFERESKKILLRTVIETQEKERSRIAQDIHDGVSTQLSVMKPILTSAKGATKDSQTHVRQGIDMSLNIISTLMASIRNTCFNVTPSTLAHKGLPFTLKKYQEIVNLGGDIQVNLDANEVELSEDKGLALYRITQEFIHNSCKHGQASNVNLLLKKTALGRVQYTLSDDGVGFSIGEPEDGIGQGLQNMKARVDVFGGQYEIESELNQGTHIKITF